ncbi:MAG: efflux RND transporter periplasmic adaptor subunit, partial [Acidobacteria bacterium]|nr:efflux RND transporter periplasmic adaptor subunit [Acidobacteriota bacterium]
ALPLIALVLWGYLRRSDPPEVAFARARRETLLSALNTNGKVEPVEWEAVRVDAPGLVEKVFVQEGQAVRQGARLARLSRSGLQAEVAAAEARVEQARAEMAVVERGGRSPELAEIESSRARALLERDVARREVEALERLRAKQAATGFEVEAARARLRQAELEIEALDRRRKALAAGSEPASAQARLGEALAALALARERAAEVTVRAPISGVVYELAARPGSYLAPGGLVASLGRLEVMRVRVYVDEPELGRVELGQPVNITWDALPGQTWQGAVEKKADAIETLGTRQVGEVLVTIPNPGRELAPGTNVNVEIRTSVVPDALTIPKDALRRSPAGSGVWKLVDSRAVWQAVATGAISATRAQITSGLAEGDAVALGAEEILKSGERVEARFRD